MKRRSKRFTWSAKTAFFLALLTAPLLASRPADAAGVEPFYENQLREGTMAASREDHARAVKILRVACFGLLDVPEVLGTCLARLALSQGALGDEEGFNATFGRLLEVEQRFAGFSKADLTAAEREQLDLYLVRWVPYDTLAASEVFREAAGSKILARISALPPRERRAELEALIAAEPTHLQWRQMAAELELESGRDSQALEHLRIWLEGAPEDPRPTCLTAWALSRLDLCGEAMPALASCDEPPGDAKTAEAAVSCTLQQEDDAAAQALIATLAPELQRHPKIRRLARQAAAQNARRAATPETAPPLAADEPPPAKPEETGESATAADEVRVEDTEPPGMAQPITHPLADRRWLAVVRQMLEASSAQQVKEGYDEIRQIAADYPEDREAQHLAAEFAIRLRRWQDAVDYFERGGSIDDSFSQRQFFYAIALFETGRHQRAAEALRSCQHRLQKTPFVLSYIEKILGPESVL